MILLLCLLRRFFILLPEFLRRFLLLENYRRFFLLEILRRFVRLVRRLEEEAVHLVTAIATIVVVIATVGKGDAVAVAARELVSVAGPHDVVAIGNLLIAVVQAIVVPIVDPSQGDAHQVVALELLGGAVSWLAFVRPILAVDKAVPHEGPRDAPPPVATELPIRAEGDSYYL